MRKLASIQRILDIQPIEGADQIERLSILGWYVVSRKDLHKKNDLVIYCEIDSKMPDVPWFEDLRNYNFRIKTIRLRGQISQGYVIPLSILSNVNVDPSTLKEDDDVTELLGITKYDPPIPITIGGEVRGSFPGFISKTDETRIQSIPDILERHKGKKFFATEKLDGTSCTVFYEEDGLHVCGRTYNSRDSETNVLWRAIRNDNIAEKLSGYRDICLQGEVIGPGIQKNKYKRDKHEFHVFNVFLRTNGKYFNKDQIVEFCKDTNIRTVNFLDDFILDHTVDQLVDMASMRSTIADTIAEGLVFRPVIEENDPRYGRLSFKAINPKFLLKHDE